MFPWFVIPLFLYCLFIGWHTMKEREAHIGVFFTFPVIFISYAVLNYIIRAQDYFNALLFFAVLLVGEFFGWRAGSKMKIRINRLRNSIIVPGSSHLMIALMNIFWWKVGVGYLRETNVDLAAKWAIAEIVVYALAVGFLSGRALNFLKRFCSK